MTRKRFVKQLMSHGMQRNEANAVAWVYNHRGVPYHYAIVGESSKLSFKTLGKSVVNFAHSLKATAEAFNTLSEVIKNASEAN